MNTNVAKYLQVIKGGEHVLNRSSTSWSSHYVTLFICKLGGDYVYHL